MNDRAIRIDIAFNVYNFLSIKNAKTVKTSTSPLEFS